MIEFTDKEILDFAKKNLTLIRNDAGKTQLSRVLCDVGIVNGDVVLVDGNVVLVDGNVRVVYGNVNTVNGNVRVVYGKTKQGE